MASFNVRFERRADVKIIPIGICANTNSAKGRVERAHLTLQDRLVKKLRLPDISTPDAANAFAAEFMAD
ncbi:hypothetical protein ACQ9PO_003220 [Cronobacter sakazakii]